MDNELNTANRFNALFNQHGNSYRTLDWGSRESQELRFRLLASIIENNNASILDVGCGLGHFFDWLNANGTTINYTGIDIADQLIAEAAQTHPEARFISGSPSDFDFLPDEKFDYVFASGIFSTYTRDANNWMEATIRRMWSWTRNGLAFNSLSIWAEKKDSNEFYADPLQVLAMCKELTPWITFHHDYHPRDFSVFLHRTARKK